MRNPRSFIALFLVVLLAIALGIGFILYHKVAQSAFRSARVADWISGPNDHPDWVVQAAIRCSGAPFLLPTRGFIGYLWDDSFRPGHRHQGIDIFGGTDIGRTPVVAAYSGYLTRLPDWKSSLIIRIPNDPIQKGRQIWTYYTHMADPQGNSFISPEFPPGSSEVYVNAGTLLGYQGNYSGSPLNPVGVHLHFSIVLNDKQGNFLNELDIRNTLDPSQYLGLPLNANNNRNEIPVCHD